MLGVISLGGEDLLGPGRDVLAAFAGRPGFVTASLGRAADDVTRWVLVSEWASVGAYRRALSSYAVRVAGAALFAAARDEPAAFEVLASSAPARVGSDLSEAAAPALRPE